MNDAKQQARTQMHPPFVTLRLNGSCRRSREGHPIPLLCLVCLLVILAGQSLISFAQPVPLSPSQLDQLVARIALYPDPLLANILTASTYWSEIPEAAAWAEEHSYLKGVSRCTKNGSSALSEQLQTTKIQNSLCQSTTWEPIGKTERLIVCCRPKSSEIIDSRKLPLF
jgi:Protein of unknown function (DUF3300)